MGENPLELDSEQQVTFCLLVTYKLKARDTQPKSIQILLANTAKSRLLQRKQSEAMQQVAFPQTYRRSRFRCCTRRFQ